MARKTQDFKVLKATYQNGILKLKLDWKIFEFVEEMNWLEFDGKDLQKIKEALKVRLPPLVKTSGFREAV